MKLIEKIKKVGVLQLLDDITGNFFSYLRYLWCRVTNCTYFGSYLASVQGKIYRHYYMQKLMENYCLTANGKIMVLEIGSWAGSSAITWAEAIKRHGKESGMVFCVDPWINYYIDSLDDKKTWVLRTMAKSFINNKIFHLFNHNITASKHDDIIIILKSYSHNLLPMFRSHQFDIVYIDGNHLYDAVLCDITNAAALLKDGGIICGDDLELQYEEVFSDNFRKFHNIDVCTDPHTNKRFHPGVTLAVWEYFKCEVSCWDGFWAMQKNNDIWEKVSIKFEDNTIIIPKHLRRTKLF